MNTTLFLVALSGICWTVVYVDAIRIGFRNKTYAIPFWALALNFAWELLCTIIGYQEIGINDQMIANIVWLFCDAFIHRCDSGTHRRWWTYLWNCFCCQRTQT